jgi:hypothetical protein
MQGPVTVYDAGGYAGDSRFADLQPGEERLLSYALDLGTEVKADGRVEPEALDAVKVVKGVLFTTHRLRQSHRYLIKNRSNQERTLLVEGAVSLGSIESTKTGRRRTVPLLGPLAQECDRLINLLDSSIYVTAIRQYKGEIIEGIGLVRTEDLGAHGREFLIDRSSILC